MALPGAAEACAVVATESSVFFTCEESCEMLGVILFIYALCDYIESHWGAVTISVAGLGGRARSTGPRPPDSA